MSQNVIINQPTAPNKHGLMKNEGPNETIPLQEPLQDGRFWLEIPPSQLNNSNNVPSGFENLAYVDKIIVDSGKNEIFEIYDKDRRNIYTGTDVNNTSLCPSSENFYSIKDKHRNEIIHFIKPTNMCMGCPCCFCICPDKMKVELANGTSIGNVLLTGAVLFPSLIIKNYNNEKLYDIEGPNQFATFCGEYVFKVYKSNTSEEVANVTTKNLNCERTCSSVGNQFELTFLQNLDIYHKALILGAAFYINNSFYDTTQCLPPCML